MTARSQAEQTEAAQRDAAKRLDDALTAILDETPGLNWKTWVEQAKAAGYKLTTETLRAVRRGDYPPSRPVSRAIEYMAGWESGGVDLVMAGDRPTVIQVKTRSNAPVPALEYDDPALQAIWEIDLLTEEERRAAIIAVRMIRDGHVRSDAARQARA
ncbi:hypothetical protein [Actinomadura sp. DC4]|uniref:hypothetical protein n=1 Tax=Actinomadura sp. DC4 TaxID=3055069 RepID=UPI0025AF587A|nr:hypothetical protein [Actinomadura sp. DC4]MDN3356027.1 hypothetical protein [Actinomadura sp. DC4]